MLMYLCFFYYLQTNFKMKKQIILQLKDTGQELAFGNLKTWSEFNYSNPIKMSYEILYFLFPFLCAA